MKLTPGTHVFSMALDTKGTAATTLSDAALGDAAAAGAEASVRLALAG